MSRPLRFAAAIFIFCCGASCLAEDHIRALQADAVRSGKALWGHWGPDGGKYSSWMSHSNRLIPVYSFGMTLDDVEGESSVYRDRDKLQALYGFRSGSTLNPQAAYFDQTDIYRLQKLAVERGKKRIVLVVFDGMDWWTTYAAAIHKLGAVGYREGRGTGLHFQDYRGADTDFGYMVTSPRSDGAKTDVNSQTVSGLGKLRGGFDCLLAGDTPWALASDPLYLISTAKSRKHAYTDSSASATSMTAGIKTYNDAVNVDWRGRRVPTIAHELQEQGFAIGVVTNVPICHATPACAYSQNVHRDDYQDLTRDLLGLPSISNPVEPLSGVDVLLGAGWGVNTDKDDAQGKNFVAGNKYLTADDRHAIDVQHGGRYVVAERTKGERGGEVLARAAAEAIERKLRLFGFFGTKAGHFPFRTADGGFDPTISLVSKDKVGPVPVKPEVYSSADIEENPTLAQMATTAIEVLAKKSESFWLLVEPGDVDWANHANNIDNSIGAVISGDDAFRAITDWIEAHGSWNDSVVILTADHGHYLVLERPEILLPPKAATEAE